VEKSKRIQRILKGLTRIEEGLNFYTNSSKEYKKDFAEIRSLIEELSLEKKTDHIRIAKKLKALWEASGSSK
jgi:hypothetical protein